MTIGISRELPLLNFEGLNMLCAWFGHPSEKLWPFEFLESFRCSISSVLIYFIPESDIWVKSYDHLNFSRAFIVQFWASRYIISKIGHSCEMLWPFEFLESFQCSILSVSICYASESDIRVKSYDHFNFYRAYVVQFQASRYIMCLNHTYERKVMTIGIWRELSLFNFERLNMLCAWIGRPSEKLWPFEFRDGFRCSISLVSIYYIPESDIWVKSYDHLNFSRATVV